MGLDIDDFAVAAVLDGIIDQVIDNFVDTQAVDADRR